LSLNGFAVLVEHLDRRERTRVLGFQEVVEPVGARPRIQQN